MSKRKGSRAERRAVKLLEAEGYVCCKAGGSLGLFDVVAIGAIDVRCVQVKSGTARLTATERRAIAALVVPDNVSREYWHFPDYARVPLIERLEDLQSNTTHDRMATDVARLEANHVPP